MLLFYYVYGLLFWSEGTASDHVHLFVCTEWEVQLKYDLRQLFYNKLYNLVCKVFKAMRSVSYVQRVSLDFTGTLFPHAICLGDADNDSVSYNSV